MDLTVLISTSVKKELTSVLKIRFARTWTDPTSVFAMMAFNVLVRSALVSKRMLELILHDLQILMSARSYVPARSGV